MFPGIVSALKERLSGFGAAPITLDIEKKAAANMDSLNAGWYLRNGYPGMYSILSGGMPAWSGEKVNTETALSHSVVWACNSLISGSVGFIPCLLYRRNGAAKTPAAKHPMYSAMRDEPNPEITAQRFTEMLTSHCLLEGNGYAQIIRRSSSGTAIELHAIQPQNVLPDREKDGQKRLIYVVKDGNSPNKTYTVESNKPQDILHLCNKSWDGIRGYSVISMARQSIGTALAAERNVARFYANGGRVPYLLEHAQKFKSDADFQRFRSEWESTYSEPHRAPILENGLTYKQIGLNAADAQLLETRQFEVAEICRWFNLPPHFANDMSHSTFSNIENLALQFVTFTLNDWLSRWESDLRRCVLTPEEKSQDYFFHHDARVLLRGDFAARMQAFSSALQNGHMSIDEVREEEDRNPLPDGAGSSFHIQLNMATVPGTGDPLPGQSPSLVRLGKQ